MDCKKISRIQFVELTNFKNVSHGRIVFTDYGRNNCSYSGDIMGIYGQNGSGKTAMVSAIALLRLLWQGYSLPSGIRHLIQNGHDLARIKVGLFFSDDKATFITEYTVVISNSDEKNTIVSYEALDASFLIDGKWTRKTTVFEYCYDSKEPIFTPKGVYNGIIKRNPDNLVALRVIKSLSTTYNEEQDRTASTSFLFARKMLTLLNEALSADDVLHTVLTYINRFCRVGLAVLENEHLAIISTSSPIIPLTMRSEEKNVVMQGSLPISIDEPMVVKKDTFCHYEYTIKQINAVLPMLVPGVSMEIASVQDKLTKKGEPGVSFELASMRNEKRIPLADESAGIKKIICVLSSMIAAFNHGDVCLVVDELDSGVYEYLLGQILYVVSKEAQGQLIFTSHNLHALEVLDSKSLTFTTTNPENCYVSLTGVKPTNNLRDLYFRSIVLGGQQEYLYNDTNQYEISFAFRNAEEFSEETKS